MDPDVALYDALTQLSSEAQWVMRAQVNSASMPATSAAPVIQADALARLAAGDPALDARLRELLGSRVAGDPPLLRRWLAWRLSLARRISVPGPDTDFTFEAGTLVIPLALGLRTRDEGHVGFAPSNEALPKVEDFRGAFRVAETRAQCVGFAVVGDPGSGKTTLLQQIYCAAYPTTAADLGLPHGLTPVFVSCRTIDRLGPDPRAWSLPRLIAAQAEADGFANAAQPLEDLARPLLLLLDGLDEVGEEAQRVRLATWLQAQAPPLWDLGWRFVVSSRYATWNRQTALSDALLTTDALSFDPPAIRDYLGRWFRAEACANRVLQSDAQALDAVFGPGPNAPTSVGGRAKGATPLGVHDLAGNVWEWCRTPWVKYPATTPAQRWLDPDPDAPSAFAAPHVVRGGSWSDPAEHLRAAYRLRYVPGYRSGDLGFRVVCRRSRQHVGPS